MIEKLKRYIKGGENIVATSCPPEPQDMMDKINELCDIINTIQKEREAERFEIQEWIGILEAVRKSVNVHEKQIDELQMKLEPEKCEARAENAQTDNEKNSEAEIPNTAYVTITADDVLVGGETATEYNGQRIYNLYHCPAYFKEARDIIREENSCELLEIHCLQSSTKGKWLEIGNPVADKNGENCWIRIKFKDMVGAERVSLWAFYYTYSSASVCASNCAINCGTYVRLNSSLRAGLFGKSDN